MDIIKLPYTSYLELSVKDFSEFIQNELDLLCDSIWEYLNLL